jgi:signal transduction histidine kinase
VRRLLARRKTLRILKPAAVVLVFAVLSTAWAVTEHHLLADLPEAWHHAILTIWGGLLAVIACSFVYAVLRCERMRLSSAARQLHRLLECYQSGPTRDPAAGTCRFQNPHLVHCRDVMDCHATDCPMHDSPNERCWQVMALHRGPRDHLPARIELERCRECSVFQLSCPDTLTEMGESFNNLMFLLEEGAEQFGRLRTQMVEKDKMAALGQIAAGVAHEVGNPLSSISSIVQMLKRGPNGAPRTDQLDLIQSHIQRISAIVRQLVTMARPSPEKWEPIDMGEVMEEAVRLVSFDRRARNVAIDFQRPSHVPRTYGLKGELQQVFINLALNAMDAMPQGGKLRIRLESTRGTLILRFEDTGCGIPTEAGRRIFEPFFTTKQPGEGAGLGLAVSYSIIQKHAGTIDFSSAAGNGTEFIIELPVLDAPPQRR